MDITTRNADLTGFVNLLKEQRTRSVDLVAPAARINAEGGQIRIAGVEPVMDDSGVTDFNGLYEPGRVADESIGYRLGIHGSYMRRMREQGRPDLWDANVNGWLHGDGIDGEDGHGPDEWKFMLRLFRGDETGTGFVRAMLSDRYQRVDNLDVLTAALGGVRDSGAEIVVKSCDLTESRMYVKIAAPAIAAYAPNLLAGYRNPFGGDLDAHGWTIPQALRAAANEGQGYTPGQEPIVFAGFVIKNSEVGKGAFSLTPHLTVRVCQNGLTFTADMLRGVHLGGIQDEGVIQFGADTTKKALELVALKARDAVKTFLNVDYVTRKVAELEKLSGTEVEKPAEVIEAVAKQSAFPTDLQDDILNAFTKGGQTTAGGIMQAVTAVAQTVEDAEIADLLESEAPKVLALAARAARG